MVYTHISHGLFCSPAGDDPVAVGRPAPGAARVLRVPSRTCQVGEQALRESGLGNPDLRGVAVKVAGGGIGACGERERRRKRLGLHVVGVRRERGPEVGIDLGGDGERRSAGSADRR